MRLSLGRKQEPEVSSQKPEVRMGNSLRSLRLCEKHLHRRGAENAEVLYLPDFLSSRFPLSPELVELAELGELVKLGKLVELGELGEPVSVQFMHTHSVILDQPAHTAPSY